MGSQLRRPHRRWHPTLSNEWNGVTRGLPDQISRIERPYARE